MDFLTPEDTIPSEPVTDHDIRLFAGRPQASGAWRDGDPVGSRLFAHLGALPTEFGGALPEVKIAYETWGTLNDDASNAVLIVHALTGDAHAAGPAGPGQPTSGWWEALVGPGLVIDTNRYFVVCSNVLGGCQGSTGPSSLAPDGNEWGSRFPRITIRDQVGAQVALSDLLGIERWFAVIGGSMGGMHVLEWAAGHQERVSRVGVIASPPITSADQIAFNSLQAEAISGDPEFRGGDYYDRGAGHGPYRGLALARRIALLTYRGVDELNGRFGRDAQSRVSPVSGTGRFAVESYLDFQGNKFTRRFDANSYLTLLTAMNSHDVGRGRGGIEPVLARVTIPSLVIGIDSDRLFSLPDQERIAAALGGHLGGPEPVVIHSPYGHDAFLIESAAVGAEIQRLLDA